jgi:hippurate hydrolase
MPQPAEEVGLGADAMVKDGLYDKAPKPDVLVASHVIPLYPAGAASAKAGRRMAGADQMDVIIYGVGGHGSAGSFADMTCRLHVFFLDVLDRRRPATDRARLRRWAVWQPGRVEKDQAKKPPITRTEWTLSVRRGLW